MNALDTIIGFFSPKRGLQRVRARQAMRVYEGAAVGRRSSSWRSRSSSANAEIQTAIRPLRNRARDLAQNTTFATRLLDIMVSHLIGDGLRPVSATETDRVDDKVDTLWEEWQQQADAEGIDTFYGQQVLATRSMIESGEVVARFINPPKRLAPAGVPLWVQLLEADFIDESREGFVNVPGQANAATKRTRLGVGLGDYDRRTGLWLYPYHPGEETTITIYKKGLSSAFVPMDELVHLFVRKRPGQVRGVTWFAPMLQTAREYADFMDAVNVKARVEACFSAFVTQADELEPILEEAASAVNYSQSNPDATISMLEPGLIKQLKPGQQIAFAQPTSNSQTEAIMMFSLMALASSVGATYDQISGDLRQANYSSLRAGKLEFRQLVTQIQRQHLIPRFCQRVWDQFIDRAILAGKLPDRKSGYPCDWMVPAFESVNPKFDQDAEERSVRAGRMTPQEFIASWGSNWRKQLRDIKAFYEKADELGVALDIDVRNYSRAGLAQKAPGANGAGGGLGDTTGAGITDEGGNVIDFSNYGGGDSEGREHGPFENGTERGGDPDVDYIKNPDGKFGGSYPKGGGEAGGGKGGGKAKAAASTAPAKKGQSAPSKPTKGETISAGKKEKPKPEDFEKEKLHLNMSGEQLEKFIDRWEERVKESPAEFKKEFCGDVDCSLNIEASGDVWEFTGRVMSGGVAIGSYTRTIDFRNKTSVLDYLQLQRGSTGKGVGKILLAHSIATLERLGIKQDKIHANIDVGGYAWAKYGYLPNQQSWSGELQREILRRIGRYNAGDRTGTGYMPESWEEIGEAEQEDIKQHYMRDTHDAYVEDEINRWREDEAPAAAREKVAADFTDGSERDWAQAAIEDFIDDQTEAEKAVPFTAEQILDAVTVDYPEGQGGSWPMKPVEIDIDDDKLGKPKGWDENQPTFPGIEPQKPADLLTDDMRKELIAKLEKAFDDKADSIKDDLEPPEWVADNVAEFQEEMWDSMPDRDKYEWASRNNYIQEIPIEDEEAPAVEVSKSSGDVIYDLARSSDPRAVWAIADSPQGKDLLLNTNWFGALDLTDKESMDRFHAYIGKAKSAGGKEPTATA